MRIVIRQLFIVVVIIGLFFPSSTFSGAETESERRQRLKQELAQIEAEIKEQEKLISSIAGQRRSLERDISLIDAKIRNLIFK